MDESRKEGANTVPTSAPERVGFRALIVDDHTDTAELFRVLLEKRGISVVVARSVATAIDAAQTAPFDILISDINLPDGNGCDLLRELRHTRPFPAIAITGLDGEDDANRCREAGFDEHFAKPASFQKVLASVRRLLGELP